MYKIAIVKDDDHTLNLDKITRKRILEQSRQFPQKETYFLIITEGNPRKENFIRRNNRNYYQNREINKTKFIFTTEQGFSHKSSHIISLWHLYKNLTVQLCKCRK